MVGERARGLMRLAPGQAGHSVCQERLLLLLIAHMCCWHSPSPPNPSGGESAAQTNPVAAASATQEAAHMVAGSRMLLSCRVGSAE